MRSDSSDQKFSGFKVIRLVANGEAKKSDNLCVACAGGRVGFFTSFIFFTVKKVK